MGKFGPTFLAFVLNCFGVNIFRTPTDFDCFPGEVYLIFLLSVFFLLWDTRIYPSTYRHLFCVIELTLEFLVVLFLMEFIMDDFWLPVLGAFIAASSKTFEMLNDFMEKVGLKIGHVICILDFLKSPEGLSFISILFSIVTLACILQATETVNFAILRCKGGPAFIDDTMKRGRRFIQRLLCTPACRRRSRHIRFAPGTKEGPDLPSWYFK